MSCSPCCQRVVVVHGTPDPVLSDALYLAGLAVAYETETLTLWAPAGWSLMPDPVTWWPRLAPDLEHHDLTTIRSGPAYSIYEGD